MATTRASAASALRFRIDMSDLLSDFPWSWCKRRARKVRCFSAQRFPRALSQHSPPRDSRRGCESENLMSSLASAFVTREALAGRNGRDGIDALAALVEMAREGDGRAFDRLMLETQERVVGVAWRLLGSREDARDAAQEVYLRVYRHLGRFRAGHDFHGWLYRITVNVCRDAGRRRRRSPLADGIHAEPGQPAEAEEALLETERWNTLL